MGIDEYFDYLEDLLYTTAYTYVYTIFSYVIKPLKHLF